VPSEREFKVGKRIITDTRNRLLPENAGKLIWFFYNQRAVSYKLERIFDEFSRSETETADMSTDE